MPVSTRSASQQSSEITRKLRPRGNRKDRDSTQTVGSTKRRNTSVKISTSTPRTSVPKTRRRMKALTRPSIEKLPDEILVAIIKFAIAGRDPERAFDNVHDLAVFTWVCKRWRNVALDNPTLWTYISATKHLVLVSLFLERSNGLPLYIDAASCDASCSVWKAFMETILPHMSRVQELHMNDLDNNVISYRPPAIAEYATSCSSESSTDPKPPITPSVLQRLDWYFSPNRLVYMRNLDELLHAQMNVTLATSALAWILPYFSTHLVELSIANIYGQSFGACYIPPPEWLDVLARVPSLRTLRLKYCIGFASDEETIEYAYPERGTVDLYRLETLELTGNSPSAFYWLTDHFKIPPSVVISISIGHRPWTSILNPEAARGDLPALLEVIGKKYYRAQVPHDGNGDTLRLLSLEFGHPTLGRTYQSDGSRPFAYGWNSSGLRIQGWNHVPSVAEWKGPGPSGFEDCIPIYPPGPKWNVDFDMELLLTRHNQFEGLLDIVRGALPLEGVRAFALSLNEEYQPNLKAVVNAYLPGFRDRWMAGVETLTMCGWPEGFPSPSQE